MDHVRSANQNKRKAADTVWLVNRRHQVLLKWGRWRSGRGGESKEEGLLISGNAEPCKFRPTPPLGTPLNGAKFMEEKQGKEAIPLHIMLPNVSSG